MNGLLLRRVAYVSCMIPCLCFSDAFMQNTETPAKTSAKVVITPSVQPAVQSRYDIFITADFIYWTARLNNLDGPSTTNTNVLTDTLGTNAGDTVTFSSSLKTHHKMSPGFKVGVGMSMDYDGWDSSLEYTWLHTSSSSQSPQQQQSFFKRSQTTINDDQTDISSNWILHFNNIDWELGREFFISPRLLLRPHIGLKGSWQKHIYTYYEQSVEALGLYSLLDRATITTINEDQKQSFWGLGTRFGMDTSWQFNRNWCIFGNGAVTALWSQFSNSRSRNSIEVTKIGTRLDTESTRTIHDTARFHTLCPVLEVDLGARWDYWFLKDKYRIRIQAAWEAQVWFDQNQFITGSAGNLSLQGLTLAFRFDF